MKLHTSLWIASIIILRFKLSTRFIEVRFDAVWMDSLEVYLIEVGQNGGRGRIGRTEGDGGARVWAWRCRRLSRSLSQGLEQTVMAAGWGCHGGKSPLCHVDRRCRVSYPCGSPETFIDEPTECQRVVGREILSPRPAFARSASYIPKDCVSKDLDVSSMDLASLPGWKASISFWSSLNVF